MTRTTPLRRTILQRSQILLLMSVLSCFGLCLQHFHDFSTPHVKRRHGDTKRRTRSTNHTRRGCFWPRKIRRNFMSVAQSGSENAHVYHTCHLGVQHYYFFSAHVKISAGPFGATSTVCSQWAERLRSRVRTVQPFAKISTRNVPWLIIGSIASVIPGFNSGPFPGVPKLGICGSSCNFRPTPWPQNRALRKTRRLGDGLHGMANIAHTVSGASSIHTGVRQPRIRPPDARILRPPRPRTRWWRCHR